MLLSDAQIQDLIDSGTLVNATKDNVGVVTYDLRTDTFVGRDGSKSDSATLEPGDSVFVQCIEGVKLPADLAARISLRNSRIRQGLTLDAPLYFPGHGTVLYFRVTNVSAAEIALSTVDGLAQVSFERVEKPAEHGYSGTFQGEMEFRGMGSYSGAYESQMRDIEKKTEEIKGVERRMYGNVIAIMAIIAGIFTLVNVNVQAMGDTLKSVLVMNLSAVGSFSALVALIVPLMRLPGKRAAIPLCVAAVCFIAAVLCAVLM